MSPWQPETSSSYRALVDLGHPQAIHFSPDGGMFFFVMRRGDVSTDSSIFELRVYRAASVSRGIASGHLLAAPSRSFEFKSDTNLPAILYARWDTDSQGIVLVATGSNGLPAVYHFNTVTSQMRTLSGDADGFARDRSDALQYENGSFVMLTVNTPPASEARYPLTFLQGEPEELRNTISALQPALNVSFRGGARRQVRHLARGVSGTVMAPGGRWAITCQCDNALARAGTFLVNLREAEARQIAPGRLLSNGVLWTPTGNVAAIATAHGSTTDLQSYEPDQDRLTQVGVLASNWSIERMWWLEPGERLLVRARGDTEAQDFVFERYQEAWRGPLAASPADLAILSLLSAARTEGLSVQVRQDWNTPPNVVATRLGREISLLEPDPALAGIHQARWRRFEYEGDNGHAEVAGLLLPSSAANQRLPVVVQAYRLGQEHFERYSPDGLTSGTSDIAQLLAVRGIAVLWMNMDDAGDSAQSGMNREGPRFVARLDAVVDALAEAGIVDRNRVGLSGFSRGGYKTYFAVTHPGRTRLVAAVADDSFTGSYPLALQIGAGVSGEQQVRTNYGTIFWEDRDLWLQNETTFNVDRVVTPTLFVAHSSGFNEETIGAFRLTHRPFEYAWLPHADHIPQRPRERIALANLTLDWMSFWLLNQEDPAPEKEPQYERWRELRATWQRQQAWEAAGNPITSMPPGDFVSVRLP